MSLKVELYENVYHGFEYTLIWNEHNGMCSCTHIKDKIDFYKFYAGTVPFQHEIIPIPLYRNLSSAKGNLKEIGEYVFKNNPEFLI